MIRIRTNKEFGSKSNCGSCEDLFFKKEEEGAVRNQWSVDRDDWSKDDIAITSCSMMMLVRQKKIRRSKMMSQCQDRFIHPEPIVLFALWEKKPRKKSPWTCANETDEWMRKAIREPTQVTRTRFNHLQTALSSFLKWRRMISTCIRMKLSKKWTTSDRLIKHKLTGKLKTIHFRGMIAQHVLSRDWRRLIKL